VRNGLVFVLAIVFVSCKTEDLYRENKTLACRPTQAGDGNRCEQWLWENDRLLRWEIFEGGGCDSMGASLVYKFDYAENGTIHGFRAAAEIPFSGQFDYDGEGRPAGMQNSLGESASWFYENGRLRRAIYVMRDTSYEVEYEYDESGNVVRAGAVTYTYDARVKNVFSNLPRAALLWVKGPEFAGPHQQLTRRNSAGAEFGYKAAVANAQGYPVRLVTFDAGLFTVAYDCQ
jgi:hypothetical protein